VRVHKWLHDGLRGVSLRRFWVGRRASVPAAFLGRGWVISKSGGLIGECEGRAEGCTIVMFRCQLGVQARGERARVMLTLMSMLWLWLTLGKESQRRHSGWRQCHADGLAVAPVH
jgi:hypothetical protein